MKKYLMCGAFVMFSTLSHAELQSIEEGELDQVTGGEGLGFMLEKFVLDGRSATTTIKDIQKSDGSTLEVQLKNLYIAAGGSANGGKVQGAVLNPVNLGRLRYPWRFGIYDGDNLPTYVEGIYDWTLNPGNWANDEAKPANYFVMKSPKYVSTTPADKTILMIGAPRRLNPASETGGATCTTASFIGANYGSNCTSRDIDTERPDIGARFDFVISANRTDTLDLRLGRVVMDGSYLRMWADDSRGGLVGEAMVNLFARTFDVQTCADGSANCSTTTQKEAATMYLTGVAANVALGYGKSQPLQFRTTDGTSCTAASPTANCGNYGNFVLRLDYFHPLAANSPDSVPSAAYTDFYNNAPTTNVRIDNMNFGGSRATQYAQPTGGYNLGRTEITGMRFTYLQVKSHDL